MLISRFFVLFLLHLSLTNCAGLRYIDVPSTNQNSRINYLVIHATSGNFAESLRLLSTPNPNPVSSHYLIPYSDDPTYKEDYLSVYRLVPEEKRAWHAGISQWAKESSLNDRSIGIEVVNDFKCGRLATELPKEQPIQLDCNFPFYPEPQIEVLVLLINEILQRHPEIDPIDVVGHADIAPNRKSDPGPQFPWEELYKRGIGAWPDSNTTTKYLSQLENQPVSVSELQCALSNYGYPIEVTGEQDIQSKFAFRAFQLHFRPANYSGLIDDDTAAILYALNRKYNRELYNHDCEY